MPAPLHDPSGRSLDVHGFSLTVRTTPRGQERAGRTIVVDPSGRRRIVSYTPARTRQASADVRNAWIAAGRPRIPEGVPFEVVVVASFARPSGHLSKTGTPTKAYRVVPRRPDVDNVLKLVLDALQPDPIADDALCRKATVEKRYAERDGLEITFSWPKNDLGPGHHHASRPE